MSGEIFKYYKPSVVTGLIAFSAIGLFLGMKHWGISVSILSFIGGMLYVIDNWLWHSPIFIWMFKTKDFRGRYEGYLEYQFVDEMGQINRGKLRHVKIISQTGSKICVYSFTYRPDGSNSSKSESKGLHLAQLQDDLHYELMYNYLNEHVEKFPHYGTDILKFIFDDNCIEMTGRYYTERQPFQTKGTYLLKRVSKNLKHDF